MKKRLSGWIETAKSMVMILLFACVLILLGVYIALLSDMWTKEDAYGGVVDKIHLLASGEHTADYPEGAYLLPESMLFRDGETSRMLYMSSDGGDEVELFCGDKIHISVSELNVKLIRFSKGGFYDRVNRKLGDKI